MINMIAGYLSGVAILISFLPYIRDIFQDKTKPERISWLIWAILGAISFFSQPVEGANYSLMMTGGQFFGDLFVFLLAIKFGFGGFMKRDKVALIGACASLFLWYVTREAAIALFMVILIDAIGVYLTVVKTYENPETETISTWAFTFVAGLLGCIAVGEFNLVLLAFPFYISLAGVTILLAIKLGFWRKAKSRVEL
jgi:hypothetical protein